MARVALLSNPQSTGNRSLLPRIRAFCAEHRDIFPSLTVRQNLLLGVKDTGRPGKWRPDDMLEIAPVSGSFYVNLEAASGAGLQRNLCRSLHLPLAMATVSIAIVSRISR